MNAPTPGLNEIVAGGLRGALLTSATSRHREKLFVCLRGRRHWIRDAIWCRENGYRWPDEVREVSPDVIDAFLPGQHAPRSWGEPQRQNPPRRDVLEMREIAVSPLRGSGIEIGAGSNPMPLPLSCDVSYVDVFDGAELRRQIYRGQAVADLVIPTIVAPFEDLSPVADESVDFVVACHVIEHTRDPIGALAGAWRKLRPNGHLALVVPEITRTFDSYRELTALAHLIDDYRSQDTTRLRDQQHFREFYALALPAGPQDYERVWSERWAEGFPIHYHTWTHESFGSMLGWMSSAGLLPKLESAWSQPPLSREYDCNEFWYLIRKAD